MKAIFTIGVSGSGKSTWALERQKEFAVVQNEPCIIIERDEFRKQFVEHSIPEYDRDKHSLWQFYKFSKSNEAEINLMIEKEIGTAIDIEAHIIFANTNLNRNKLNTDIDKMKALGFDIEIHSMIVPFETAVKQDLHRLNSVGRDFIEKQWLQWLDLREYNGILKYAPDSFKRKAILVDIDGTIADKGNRAPFDWSRVLEDKPISPIIDFVRHYQETTYSEFGYTIIFLSGRDEICREDTYTWLKYNGFDGNYFKLFMRPHGNYEKDSIIKERIFFTEIADNYNVKFVLDDRKQVIRMWTDIGLKVINCGNIYDNF